MDERLLHLYERELQFLREGANEFAQCYPKVAAHLSLDSRMTSDPGVERLLEGLGFLTARIQLQMESEFPQFTENLLQQVQPQSLLPVPPMAVVQVTPDRHQGSLVKGFCLPVDSALSANAVYNGRHVRSDWRTSEAVTLWPIEITAVDYLTSASLLPGLPSRFAGQAHSAIRLRLRTTTGVPFSQLDLKALRVYLTGQGSQTSAVHEALLSRCVGMLARPAIESPSWCEIIEPGNIVQSNVELASASQRAALGDTAGVSLLKRFLAFPERYRFIDLCGLGPAVQRCAEDYLEIVMLLAPLSSALPVNLDRSLFALFCVPVQNLFRKRTDRHHLVQHSQDVIIRVDHSNPLAHEVHQVLEVHGYLSGSSQRLRFLPLYSPHVRGSEEDIGGFFQVRRVPSRAGVDKHKGINCYVGSDVSVSLVDPRNPPYTPQLHQLVAEVLCSNRDAARHIQFGKGSTDFVLEVGAPVTAIRCVAGPSIPRATPVAGNSPWQAIQHLSRNYLPLVNDDGQAGANALRELLSLYVAADDQVMQRLLEGIVSLQANVVTQRLPGRGPVAFGRGLELKLTLDDDACEGTGAFLFGAVLDAFFARYAPINAFTQTVLHTHRRGLIMRWPARGSQCMTI
ncbi:type VI secretion system baseplate subunit TssF [Pseudomonas vranovensis]|uniref:type VI secretion system baseplate subunit TssF n=1 Tax=Pseudomonas vranovensis TaxID=321661 RepID=UPI0003F7B061|nr:type VI secretion system baseplate subunit TssF [Pseudomonas vranovensis]